MSEAFRIPVSPPVVLILSQVEVDNLVRKLEEPQCCHMGEILRSLAPYRSPPRRLATSDGAASG